MTAITEKSNLNKKRTPGRPKKAINRSSILMVRLTPTERLLIEERAKKAGIKPSEWFRRAAKSAKVFPRFTAEETAWFRMLAGLANNFNQYVQLAHTNGLLSMAIKGQAVIRQVEALLTKLNKHDG
ncbi:plasmid mobilization protein [Mucilaginibacter lacusdianchii]|uniref:plasmid mobilization protein n=1 Tax=Mucilaginibacter lacusdianchii TaxID=2684211 RepID=UPI00131CB8A8|nr:hypothetical protein [Mucilaginibacter sp. JXJ CY 39]